MKKIIISILACLLLINVFIPEVYATEKDEVIILDGDGSFDNPYIIEDNDNEIIKFINNNYDKLNSSNPDVANPLGLSSASTTVDTSKTISSSGAYWKYTSGGGTTATNGSLVYTLIEYVPYSKMGDMCALALKSNVQSSLRSAAVSTTVSAAKSILSKVGITNTLAATGFLPGVGFLAAAYGGVSMANTFITACNNNVLADTQLHKHHLMIVHFKTSYNGSWFLYSRVEESTTQTHPQIPIAKYYGNGTFTNSSRIK